jgi:enterochelin esterase-like enzyme
MKKILISVVLLFVCLVHYGQGVLKESLSIPSAILKRTVKYSIYLPQNYEAGNRKYPVLYLLHGYTDNETGWTQYGEVSSIADKAISSGDATPMIIAMPDGGVTWYINESSGKERFEDFFVQEFIPYIDSVYRTRNTKQFRAVAGLSMGGFGTLIYSLKHPELFSAAAPLSAAVWTDEQFIDFADDRYKETFEHLFGPAKGKERITVHYKKNSILNIINTSAPKQFDGIRFYIDCGDKDFLIKGNMALHAAMIDKKIEHEFRVRSGVHDWIYWRTALPEVLKFVSESFHR